MVALYLIFWYKLLTIGDDLVKKYVGKMIT